MSDEQTFTVGQEVTISGGKWKKVLNEESKCLITSLKSTFCEISLINKTDPDAEPRKIQVHRKFLVAVDGSQVAPDPVPEEDNGGVEMPSQEDCVEVTQEQMDAFNKQGSSGVESIVQEVIDDVVETAVETGDELQRLRARVKELEADCESYRDMMMGHQNELNFLRTQTGPSIEERKQRNEKIIQCINILCQLQQ